MHFLKVVITIWQREILRYWRDKTRIFSTLFQPLMFLFVFGSGLRKTFAPAEFGIDFMQFMYPGIIAMSIMGVAFFSTISTVWDREFGFLREILVAPVSRTAIALGKTLGAASIASLQGLILLIIAPFLQISLRPLIVLQLFFLMLLLSFAIAGIGLFIASLMKTTESFGLLMQILIFPMFFLSGAFFPLIGVPLWMTILTRLNPLSYGVDAMRAVIFNGALSASAVSRLILYPVYVDILLLLIFSTVFVSAAVVAFNRKS